MQHKWKYVILGATLGGLAASALALPQVIPAALAEDVSSMVLEVPGNREVVEMLTTSHGEDLFKPDWIIEPSVSRELNSSGVVRKISGGRTSFVSIATTASGVYSSDGLASSHIRYPGVHGGEGEGSSGMLSILSHGLWSVLRPISAGSFAYVVPNGNGISVISDRGSCHFVDQSVIC